MKTTSSFIQKCEYDGLNRRIVKKKYVAGVLNETRHYFYNEDWQVVEERVGTDPVTAQVEAQHVWNPEYVDSLALRRWDHDANSSTAMEYHYYLQDANYNVTAVAHVTGAVAERYAYTPYGEVTVLNGESDYNSDGLGWTADADGSDVKNAYLYTGRERDPETGLQLNRHRYYAAHLGRWISRDPIEYEGSEWNLYEYAHSTPTMEVDPSGEIPPILIGIGIGIGMAWGCDTP